MPPAFAIAFARDLPFGRCVAVALPEAVGLDDVFEGPRGVRLHAGELAYARALPEGRRVTWVGGRLALRAALADLGVAGGGADPIGPIGPILATPRGAPALPPGLVGSISHKPAIAVALAARAGDDATVGIDVEIEGPTRRDIARLVLTDAERARLPAGAEARAREVKVAFAGKEAIYKALDPWVQRRVLFREVAVTRAPVGALRAPVGALRAPAGALHATLALAGGEGPFAVELHEEPAPGLVLMAARVRRAG